MICVPIITNPLFKKSSRVIVSKSDNVKKFASIKTAIIKRDFKCGYLVSTCSVVTNLVTSLEFDSDLCYHAMPFLANDGKIPFSGILTPIAR